jgi:beta-galactosidase
MFSGKILMLKRNPPGTVSGCIAQTLCILACLVCLTADAHSQTKTNPQGSPRRASEVDLRLRLPLNDGWKFSPADARDAQKLSFDDARWPAVTLPHTWNAEDTQDDLPGYRLGVGWYRKKLNLDGRFRNKKVFLYFEAANQVTDVFVNGNFVGQHKGGYTAFAFDISNYVTFDPQHPNVVAVKVDNSINKDIPPSPSADFNLYGGIYRDVWLIATEPVHVSLTDHASSGVYVETPTVSNESASVRVRGHLSNQSGQPRTVRVVNTVLDAYGLAVSVMESSLTLGAGQDGDFEQTSHPIYQPRLWSPENPYLYSVQTLLYEGERPLDSVVNPLGFRWFSFDAQTGFSLNGKPYKLHGANRHQDYLKMGNAVPNELQLKDMQLIKEMGMNCVLLAHYPQDPSVLEAADKIGLFVWEEVPVLRQISTSPEFADNSKQMLTEMIRQHFNHPSIIIWCYMNEIFLRMSSEAGYVQKVVGLAKELDDLARREDPGRVTVISANRNEIYNTSGLADIPQLFAWHMYFGWYYGTLPEFGQFLDEQHRRFPRRKIFVSEYGADSDGRVHSLDPQTADYSTEWAQQFHQSYLEQLEGRPYLNGSAVWNAFDFGSESRGESFPHVNKKGLFTFDRQPKDVSYLYQASYSSKPVLRIATREWSRRTGTNRTKMGVGPQSVKQPVTVYSNLKTVDLLVNGKSLGVKQLGSGRSAVWEVPFRDGVNVIEARGNPGTQQLSDRVEVTFTYRAARLADAPPAFPPLAVNVGSASQYIDRTGLVWEADQPYEPGGWGYLGGTPDKIIENIQGTEDDPLWRSFRRGIQRYRFDVADGNY